MPTPHLCFVNSLRGWGGAEIWFLDTALALRERGHGVSIIAQPDSELCRRARQAGLRVGAIPIRFDAAPWTLARLIHFFRRGRVTAVVTNLTKDLKAAATAGRLAGVGTLLASRESDFPLKNKAYYRWYFTRLATGLLVNSEATRRTVRRSAPWLSEERVHLLYKGIDLQKFHPVEEAAEPVVGFAGQLIARKGLACLMQAWTALEMRGGTAHLRLAGAGPMLSEVEGWRRGLQHPDRVEILHQVEDMPAFYQGCRLLAMPSRSEGFGLSAAEALACGVPVVATDASSLPEIVRHQQNGRLIPVDDHEALTDAMAELLDNPQHAQQLGLAGRDHMVQNFDKEMTLDRLEKLTGLTRERPTT